MIQRIQTLYLFLAAALSVVCLCLPIGRFTEDGVYLGKLYNLFLVSYDNAYSYTPWALFVILVLVTAVLLLTILLFRKRMRQVRLCIFSSLLLIGYYLSYGAIAYLLKGRVGTGTTVQFSIEWPAALPLVALIFVYLAWRGIMKDELLVRSLDRLR